MFARNRCLLFLLFALLITLSAQPAWAGQCSLATVSGTYTVFEQGSVIPQAGAFPIPAVLVATATFDGAGSFTGTYTRSFGGAPAVTDTFAGTYVVTPDCGYSDTFEIEPTKAIFHHKGYITGDGIFQEAHYIYTDAGLVTSGTAKKQK